MNNFLLKEQICRICLKHNAKLNWNDEVFDYSGVSFKDCYYKYTQLEEIVPDCYPTYLCNKCANGVKQAHILFEKALDSYVNLQNTLKTKDLDENYIETNNRSGEVARSCTLNENYSVENLKEEETVIDGYEVILFPSSDTNAIKNERGNDFCDIDFLQTSAITQTGTESKNILPLSDEKVELESILETSETELESSRFIKQGSLKRIRNKVTKPKSRGTEKTIQVTSGVQGSVEECELSNDPLINTNIEENTTTPLAKCRKSRKSTKFNKKNRKTSRTSDSTLDTNLAESDTTSLLPLTDEFSESNELRKSYETVKTFDDELRKNSLFQKEISKDDAKKSARRKAFKRLLCQHCPYKTNDRCDLSKHEAKHIENRERNVICSICGVKFYSQPTLKWHMKTHEENRIKKHKCEFCEKSYFNKGALNVHRRIHLGLMVKCQICEKEYCRRSDLERHLMRQHSSSTSQQIEEKKKYVVQCQYCDKSIFTNKLKGHVARHLNQPQAKCKICEKDFFTRTNCTSHLRRFHKISRSDFDKYVLNFGSRACFLKTRQEAEVKIVT